MAAQAHEFLCSNGYDAIGFDHFAPAPMTRWRAPPREGTLRRPIYPGGGPFTDDPSEVLIGMGSEAPSAAFRA